MAEKPKRASEHKSEHVELVRATCLYLATKLGDMMDDLLIVGGLVPSLIVDQETLAEDVEPHVGTMDLDVGLQLALLDEGRDRRQVTLTGTTLFGEKAMRQVWVCDAGAYLVLKALAFDGRGENKDAYDLFYVLRNYGSGVDSVVDKVRPLVDDPEAQRALAILKRDFSAPLAVGPMRVAMFVIGGRDDEIQADVVSFVNQLLTKMGTL